MDPVTAHTCVCLWRSPQGCALQSVLRAEEYWGADMRSGVSTLKLLKLTGELTVTEGGEDAVGDQP